MFPDQSTAHGAMTEDFAFYTNYTSVFPFERNILARRALTGEDRAKKQVLENVIRLNVE